MDHIFAVFAMAVPIVAIVGGISVAIVRLITQARLEELSRRERIAAIERGVDPSKLPPIPGTAPETYPYGDSRLRRAHGLLIGGLILIATGIGLGVLAAAVEPSKSHWVIGLLPILIGAALLACSRIVWPPEK
jgi:uncharacterized protein DUF6249